MSSMSPLSVTRATRRDVTSGITVLGHRTENRRAGYNPGKGTPSGLAEKLPLALLARTAARHPWQELMLGAGNALIYNGPGEELWRAHIERPVDGRRRRQGIPPPPGWAAELFADTNAALGGAVID